MRTLVAVYADKPDFNHSNALIMYSITNIAKHYGYNTIVVSEDYIPDLGPNKVRISSYISSIPNTIIEKWIRSMNISITLSELLHEVGLSEILCYGISCLLAITPIRKIVGIRVIYIPSIMDIETLKSDDKLISETLLGLLVHALDHIDLIFDYELGIRKIIGSKRSMNTLFTNDPKILEDFILKEADEK